MPITSSVNDKFNQVLSQVFRQKVSRKKALALRHFSTSNSPSVGAIHATRKTTLEEKFSKYFRD